MFFPTSCVFTDW